MITSPRQHQEDPYPKSPKRKLDAIVSQPWKLQTTNLDTPGFRRLEDISIDETLSPRAAVSAKLQGLHLQSSSNDARSSIGRSSWTVKQASEADSTGPVQNTSSMLPMTEEESTGPLSNSRKAKPNEAEETASFKHDIERAVFQFRAGSHAFTAAEPEPGFTSPFKRATFAAEDGNEQVMQSPSKRQRRASPSVSSSPQPIPRSMSPSARKLSHRSPPPSEVSSSPGDAELAQHWWQPSEIIGHDPDDPEDDNRGVNGIGYQKTKAEQWRISERKKRQLAEWRSREAKEARSLRAGGRRVIMGRVSKPGSRAGSPSDGTAPFRGRLSPAPRSLSDEKKMEEVVRRAVRFEIG